METISKCPMTMSEQGQLIIILMQLVKYSWFYDINLNIPFSEEDKQAGHLR